MQNRIKIIKNSTNQVYEFQALWSFNGEFNFFIIINLQKSASKVQSTHQKTLTNKFQQ